MIHKINPKMTKWTKLSRVEYIQLEEVKGDGSEKAPFRNLITLFDNELNLILECEVDIPQCESSQETNDDEKDQFVHLFNKLILKANIKRNGV
jgi:hypothetical protein